MICVDIALRLVELRNKLGMSRTSFAKSIGITETHMRRFETGVSVPKEKHINTICEKYHVNPAYFTGEIGIDEAITEMPEDDRKNAGKRLKECTMPFLSDTFKMMRVRPDNRLRYKTGIMKIHQYVL